MDLCLKQIADLHAELLPEHVGDGKLMAVAVQPAIPFEAILRRYFPDVLAKSHLTSTKALTA